MSVLRPGMSTSGAATGDDALPGTEARQRGLQARIAIVSVAVLGGIATILGLELAGILAATGGHMVYALEALYTHLALAGQIAQGHYGLVAGEAAAPSSSILYPFLLAALSPLGLGTLLPAVINIAATIATGVFALFLAAECGIPLHRVAPARLFLLAATLTLALNLAGLAFTGLEHSLHVACTVAYLLGLLRFVRRGRCDWWWFVCIIVQPLIRFEAAGMLVADALIFVSFRRYGYAAAMVLIGVALVGGYCLFLHALGLPLLPSSVLARSDWSNAAVGTHRGLITVVVEILRNFQNNINMFGASQVLGGVAVAFLWLGNHPVAGLWRLDKRDQAKLMTIGFMAFVSLAQLVGGKLGWSPPRYEAYVLVLNLCGLAIVYQEKVVAWCERATWQRTTLFSVALLLIFAGYARQTFLAPGLARKEYLGAYQLHRFVTEFYRGPVAVDQLGYINYDNPNYVLDLSGLASESARIGRAQERSPEWMDPLLARHDVSLAIIDNGEDPVVPAAWTPVAALDVPGLSGTGNRFVLYARRPEDVSRIASSLDRFAPTLPSGAHLKRADALGNATAGDKGG